MGGLEVGAERDGPVHAVIFVGGTPCPDLSLDQILLLFLSAASYLSMLPATVMVILGLLRKGH